MQYGNFLSHRPLLCGHRSNPQIAPSTASPQLPPLERKPQRSIHHQHSFSTRIPHKYDHFHEKTYELDFVPKFDVNRFERKTNFAGIPIERIREYHISPERARAKLQKHKRIRSFIPAIARERSVCKSPEQLPVSVKSQVLKPCLNNKASPRFSAVICVQDGSWVDDPSLRSVTVDLQRLYEKYIGFSCRRQQNETEETLSKRALQEILELGTAELRPDTEFSAVYLVNGVRMTELMDMPEDCKALVLGWDHCFLGLNSQ